MAEHSFPFAAVDNDRVYSAADWAAYFAQFISNGVFPIGAQLQVTAGSGMHVNVSAGGAWINGYGYVNSVSYTLSIGPADGVLNRKDRVVVRWGRVERAIFLYVLKGATASSAIAPALVRNADYYDICLAELSINAGITQIASGHISDKRLDPSLCGIVSSLITPDTAGWYEGWEAEFQTWFDTVKGLMAGDPSTNFAVEIAELQENVGVLEKKDMLLTTSGTAPAFTVTDSSVTAYAAGLIRLVQFHADGTDVTLKFNALSILPVYDYTGKPTKVKAGQALWVRCTGTSFFVCSGGGGVSLPQSIQAGETFVLSVIFHKETTSLSYISAGRGFTAAKAGTYRFRYDSWGFTMGSAGYGKTRLMKNGVAVANSEVTGSRNPTYKTIEVALAAGDVITVQFMEPTSYSACTDYFSVSILAVDIQAELNSLGALNAG